MRKAAVVVLLGFLWQVGAESESLMTQFRYGCDVHSEFAGRMSVVTFCQGTLMDITCPSEYLLEVYEAIYDLSPFLQQCDNVGVSVWGCGPYNATSVVRRLCNLPESCRDVAVRDDILLPEEEYNNFASDDNYKQCQAQGHLTVAFCCRKSNSRECLRNIPRSSVTRTTVTTAKRSSTTSFTSTSPFTTTITPKPKPRSSSRPTLSFGQFQTMLESLSQSFADLSPEQRKSRQQDIVESFSSFIEQRDSWNSSSERTLMTNSLIEAIDQVGFLSLSHGSDAQVQTKNIQMMTGKMQKSELDRSQAPITTLQLSNDSQVALIANNFDALNETLEFVLVEFKNATHLFGKNPDPVDPKAKVQSSRSLSVASSVVSVKTRLDNVIHKSVESRSGKPIVKLVMRSPDQTASNAALVCGFWKFTPSSGAAEWSTNGCWTGQRNATHVVCECNHLTSFALLMDYTGATSKSGIEHQVILHYITVIGTFFSCVCLLLLAIAFFKLRSLKSSRSSKINKNLIISLLLALLFYLIASLYDFSEHGAVVCKIVAGSLHYLFLVAFAWFAIEGVYLYFTLVLVFSPKRSDTIFKLFCIAAYGLPACVVGVTAGGWPDAYGVVASMRFCWLQAEGGYVWAFIGPVCFVMLSNIGSFATALYVVCSRPRRPIRESVCTPKIAISTANVSKSDTPVASVDNRSDGRKVSSLADVVTENEYLAQLIKWCKTSFILVNILGLSWALGLLYFGDETLVFAYLFTVVNSFQGVLLFAVYLLLDKKVHRDLRRYMEKSSTVRGSASIKNSSASMSNGTGRSPKLSKALLKDPSGYDNPMQQKYSVSCCEDPSMANLQN